MRSGVTSHRSAAGMSGSKHLRELNKTLMMKAAATFTSGIAHVLSVAFGMRWEILWP